MITIHSHGLIHISQCEIHIHAGISAFGIFELRALVDVTRYIDIFPLIMMIYCSCMRNCSIPTVSVGPTDRSRPQYFTYVWRIQVTHAG